MAFVVFMSSFPVSASSGGVINAGEAASSYVPISIDGNFEDWADKPHSQLSYSWDTNNNYHSGALFRDETYIYLHIRMSPNSYTQFNGNNYIFNVDNMPDFGVQVETVNYSAIVEGENQLVIRRQSGYKIIDSATGYLTRTTGQPDEWELRIPLETFQGTVKNIRTITFRCSNLGEQTLIATGTPTLPYLIVAGGLVIAVAGYQISRRKRKKA
jgi:uncharacterized protein (TIGR04145 family)